MPQKNPLEEPKISVLTKPKLKVADLAVYVITAGVLTTILGVFSVSLAFSLVTSLTPQFKIAFTTGTCEGCIQNLTDGDKTTFASENTPSFSYIVNLRSAYKLLGAFLSFGNYWDRISSYKLEGYRARCLSNTNTNTNTNTNVNTNSSSLKSGEWIVLASGQPQEPIIPVNIGTNPGLYCSTFSHLKISANSVMGREVGIYELEAGDFSSVPVTTSKIVSQAMPIIIPNDQLGSSGVSSGSLVSGISYQKELYRFQVTAENGDIGLYKVTFNVAQRNVTVTNLKLYNFMGRVIAEGIDQGGTSIIHPIIFKIRTPSAVPGDTLPYNIPAGYSLPLTLKGDVNCSGSCATSGASVSISLLNDGLTIPVEHWATADNVYNSNNGQAADFIWTDYHWTSYPPEFDVWASNQWTNGSHLLTSRAGEYLPESTTAVVFRK